MNENGNTSPRSALLDRAERALRSCEAEMQALVAEAASTARYDEIDRLTTIARSLSEMAQGAASAQRLDRLVGTGSPRQSVPPRTERSRARKPSARADYPLFARDGDDLIKIGWSKKKREQYVHRARRDRVESIVSSLADRGRRSGLLSKDDILRIHDPSGGEIPSYQIYLTLGWLRKEELVERRGRNGYVVPNAAKLESTFLDLWNALSEYRGS